MTQSMQRPAGALRHLQSVGEDFTPLIHQPWCDLAEHAGRECRSTPIDLRFGYRGTNPHAISSATLQAISDGGALRPRSMRARLRLDGQVLELGIDQVAAIGTGLQSLLMAMTGVPELARDLAARAEDLAETVAFPAAAEV